MVIFHSYVKLPEGKRKLDLPQHWISPPQETMAHFHRSQRTDASTAGDATWPPFGARLPDLGNRQMGRWALPKTSENDKLGPPKRSQNYLKDFSSMVWIIF